MTGKSIKEIMRETFTRIETEPQVRKHLTLKITLQLNLKNLK